MNTHLNRKEKKSSEKEKILKGLALSYQKLIAEKRLKQQEIAIIKDGKIKVFIP